MLVLQDGLPMDTPAFAQLLETRTPLFVNGWTEAEQQVEHTAQFQAVALYPVEQHGQLCGALTVALQAEPRWGERDKSIVNAIGRSFSLLYERAATAKQLRERQQEAERRSQVLEAFEALSAELSVEQDSLLLIRRAMEVVLSLLPSGHAAYWEPVGPTWHLRAFINEVGNQTLQTLMEAGLVVDQTPTLDRPWQTGEPLYQDSYASGSDVAAEMTHHVYSVVSIPIWQGAAIRGVMNFTTFQPYRWQSADRTLLATVIQSLKLALDRASQTQQLQEERAGLDAFVAFSERAGDTSDLLELARRAIDVMRTTIGNISAAYYTLEGAFWKAQVWSEDFAPDIVAVLVAGIPVTAPSYAEAVQTQQVVFVPGWEAESEGVANTETFGAGAFYPCFVDDRPQGLLAMGTQRAGDWTAREQAVFSAVGRSLTLALERTERARQLLQQRDVLELKTQELQAANEDLEAFTYSASHDLRTPVRHVMGFAELAEKALAKGQYEKVGRSLEVVKQGALPMTSLIDGMLLLSRSGRQDLHVQPVDLNVLVVQARRDTTTEFGGHPVRWQIGELPRVLGDHQLLQQVMTNLLSNAVKYSAKREVSEVRVWCEGIETDWFIRVQDNGVGFEPQYAQRLFGIFQRLHTEKEFKGTGVGLATVKRIVQKHGGQVFAESDGLTGATFGFSLPKEG